MLPPSDERVVIVIPVSAAVDIGFLILETVKMQTDPAEILVVGFILETVRRSFENMQLILEFKFYTNYIYFLT